MNKRRPAITDAEGGALSLFAVTVGRVYDGPLDLLLDLVRKQNIDIHDIPMARITEQFLAYAHHVKQTDVDAAADFLYTASVLIHIKSKVLLPVDVSVTGATEAGDPRRELVDRLLEHERFKAAGLMLQERQMLEESSWTSHGEGRTFAEESAPTVSSKPPAKPKDETIDLVEVFQKILDQLRDRPRLQVSSEQITVEQMVDFLMCMLDQEELPLKLGEVISQVTSTSLVVSLFLAMLELVRMQAVLVHQPVPNGEVYLKKGSLFDEVTGTGLGAATTERLRSNYTGDHT